MFSKVWPTKLNTPHIPLGLPFKEAIGILKSISREIVQENDKGEVSYRVNTEKFSVAIYEQAGFVTSVWYNDSAGRLFHYGKQKKIDMYLGRYTSKGSWEKRMNNGWITYYFNDMDYCSMAYGNHKDVIRFNIRVKNT